MKEFKILSAVFVGLLFFWYAAGSFIAASFDISLWRNRVDITWCFVVSFAILGLFCLAESKELR